MKEDIKTQFDEAYVYLFTARTYWEQGNFDKAKSHLDEAMWSAGRLRELVKQEQLNLEEAKEQA